MTYKYLVVIVVTLVAPIINGGTVSAEPLKYAEIQPIVSVPKPLWTQYAHEPIKEIKTDYTEAVSLEPVYIAPPSMPYAPMGTYPNSYAPANCTWGVASMKSNVPNNWGNAKDWLGNAQATGVQVSSQPVIGSIGVSTSGYYGHVVLVIGVGSGTVTVREMNYDNAGSVRDYTYTTSKFVYIYL